MKSANEYPGKQSPAILVCGLPKTGKTRLLAGFPVPGVVDCDMNLISALRIMPNKEFYFEQPLLDPKTNLVIPDEDRHKCWPNSVNAAKEMVISPKVKTLVVDGLTAMAQWGLLHCESELVKAGVNTKKEYLAKFQSFITLMTNFVTTMRLAGKPIVFTCHTSVEQSDVTKIWYTSLAIPGQLKDRLGGLFTDVWATYTKLVGDRTKYFIKTRPTSSLDPALGTSFDLPAEIDVTDKSPEDVWKILEPKLGINLTVKPLPVTAVP